MKIGGGVIFISLIIVLFFRWYGREEEKTKAEMVDLGYAQE